MGVTVVGGPGGGANVLSIDETTASQDLGELYDLIPSVSTGAELQFALGIGDSLTFTGNGFGRPNANGVPQTGTITGLTITVNGVVESTFRSVDLSMQSLWSAVTDAHNGDANAAPNLLTQIFAGADTRVSDMVEGFVIP